MRSRRAPLPRWKRATGSSGTPRELRARRKYQVAARMSGSRTVSTVCALKRHPSSSSTASAALSASVNAADFSSVRSRLSQAAKPATGDSVTKVDSFGISRLISSATCLIRKLPKETPDSPRWQLEIE